jgi:predicted DNA-binding protein
MISKTRESGRAELLIRMRPELKERIEKAARLVGRTKTDWVLGAIEAILHVQELQADAQEEIRALRGEFGVHVVPEMKTARGAILRACIS